MKKTLSAVIFCTVLVTLAGFVGCKSELISQDSLVGYYENVNSTFSESVVLGKKLIILSPFLKPGLLVSQNLQTMHIFVVEAMTWRKLSGLKICTESLRLSPWTGK